MLLLPSALYLNSAVHLLFGAVGGFGLAFGKLDMKYCVLVFGCLN